MLSATPICVPVENVNDDTVKLIAWRVSHGAEVQEGQLFAEVETSKALVEMVAPQSGKLWHRAAVGQEMRVGTVIAYITANGEVPPSEVENSFLSAAVEGANQPDLNTQTPLPTGTSFSKKALELIQKQNVPVNVFAGRGLVREQDVREYLERTPSSKPYSDLHVGLKGISLDQVTLPRLFSDLNRGLVEAEFLEQLRRSPNEFGQLSSAEKCRLYRQHGAHIGEGVEIGAGSLVIAPQIVLGAEANLGENSSVVCRERFYLGTLTSFGRNLNVRGGTVVLGDDIWAGQNIRIGGGGHADPWSLLVVGDNSYLGDDLYINICRAILIGTYVFLTQRSIVMTHNVGHSILDGYENRFAPVVLGDYSQVGMLCTIYAGTVIGTGSIVGSNSYVISSIAPGKLAMGVPARVIRDSTRKLDRPRQIQLVNNMLREYHELLCLKGHHVGPLQSLPYPQFRIEHDGKEFLICFLESLAATSGIPLSGDEVVIWTLGGRTASTPTDWTVMDLLSKQITGRSGIFVNSTREFLRKRGIRCQPSPWRYRGGLI